MFFCQAECLEPNDNPAGPWERGAREEPTTLGYLMADYVVHLEHHLAELEGRVPAG